ncbi:MAG: allophanate hydrolase subunit 1 [Verrucomicrobia bacterium]|nr:allophanate hydrolase subunit 1 [Verrucomicrobiota bacterium]
MKWIPYGPGAIMLHIADRLGEKAFLISQRFIEELERHPPFGLLEIVPSFTRILLEFDERLVPNPMAIVPDLELQLKRAPKVRATRSTVKEISAVYDGPDLERVAELNRLTVAEVCRRHAAVTYRVYMLGFSPGFPYLGLLDRRLHTPRLPSPRTAIAPGSIGIGGEHTGIYTVPSPGGWNIIGHVLEPIFDPGRGSSPDGEEAMFLLKPGDRVKFVPVKEKTR